MKNHGKVGLQSAPHSSLQARSKPRKRKNRLKNYQNVVEMIFLPPQTILEWLRHPMALLKYGFSYSFMIFSCFFMFFS